MKTEEFNREIRLLYAIAKANGDASTGLSLLMMIVDSEKHLIEHECKNKKFPED